MTPSKFSIAVVDDERLARSLLASLIRRDPELVLLGEYEDGADALSAMRNSPPDIVLVDIQMSVLDGITLAGKLQQLQTPPYIIFVTAYDRYATKAFDLNALDYLVKPVEKARFRTAIDRAKQAIRLQQTHTLTEKIVELAEQLDGRAQNATTDNRIIVRKGDELVSLSADRIAWVEAANQYVCIHADKGEFMMSGSLSSFEDKLSDCDFLRIHRSTLVNTAHVRAVSRAGNGTHEVSMSDGSRLTVARSKTKLIAELLRCADVNAS